jgi:hypothetical protein
MTRAELFDYLADTFTRITKELNLPEADTDNSYRYPLDQAFRRLGVAETSLATAEVSGLQVEQATALGEYYSLLRFWTITSTRTDYPAEGMAQKRSQLFTQIGDLLQRAEKRCEALGVSVTGTTELQRISLLLDYIEPELTNG